MSDLIREARELADKIKRRDLNTKLETMARLADALEAAEARVRELEAGLGQLTPLDERRTAARVVGEMSDDTAVDIARYIKDANPRPSGKAECAALMRAALQRAIEGGT
jgi:flagellar motility protein MotE (MotC chaperone)